MRNTKEKIMDVAERCIARNGIAGASIRTIVKEARVNLGAVTYHFGSKDNLLAAIFKRRMLPINRERISMLEKAEKEADGKTIPLRKVIEAILMPQRRVMRRFPDFSEFLLRMKKYPNPKLHSLIDDEFNAVFERFDHAVRSALPPTMSEAEIFIKRHFFIHMLDSVPENDFHIKQQNPNFLEGNMVTQTLISFVEGGLMTPVDPFATDAS